MGQPDLGHNSTSTTSDKGRPTVYTPELAAELCAYLAEGKSLRTVAEIDGMPGTTTIFRWLSASNKEDWAQDFREQYARAKEEAADAMAEDVLDIADDGSNDYMERQNKDGSTYVAYNGDAVQRSRLRVDTRKWLMSKMKPKKYGEKLDLTSGGEKIDRGMSLEDIDAILARAEAEAARPKAEA